MSTREHNLVDRACKARTPGWVIVPGARCGVCREPDTAPDPEHARVEAVRDAMRDAMPMTVQHDEDDYLNAYATIKGVEARGYALVGPLPEVREDGDYLWAGSHRYMRGDPDDRSMSYVLEVLAVARHVEREAASNPLPTTPGSVIQHKGCFLVLSSSGLWGCPDHGTVGLNPTAETEVIFDAGATS